MTRPTVIGVFGLSGVGKTTMIRQWLAGRADALHLQASTLIKQGLADPALDSEMLRRSSGQRILANQAFLVEMFKRTIAASEAALIVFDGHLLIDTDEDLVEIPLEVVAALKPHVLVHVEEAPKTIANRRRGDKERTRPDRDVQALQQQQERSSALCEEYGNSLGLHVAHVGKGTHLGIGELVAAAACCR